MGKRGPAGDSKGSEGLRPPLLPLLGWGQCLVPGHCLEEVFRAVATHLSWPSPKTRSHGAASIMCCRWLRGWGGPLGGTAMPVCPHKDRIARGSQGVPSQHGGAGRGFPFGVLPQPEPAPRHQQPHGEGDEGQPQEVA